MESEILSYTSEMIGPYSFYDGLEPKHLPFFWQSAKNLLRFEWLK
jgi:hypothetical protein